MEVWKEIDGYNQRYEVSNFTLEYPWYCEFVHDDDRKALNMAAGWSDNKKLYLLDCVKFK